ncbi:MAG: hypothetical protein LCH39_05350 [Proteobacteria bacterium]|nr:hypothetical protein [Pseudomonadota bacterium]
MKARVGAGVVAAAALAAPAFAQAPPREDFFVRPPQVQAPQVPGQGGQQPPLAMPGASVTADVLVKQGFEVKAVSKTSDKATDYLLVLQRSGELRTCLMRLSRDTNSRALKRESVCF